MPTDQGTPTLGIIRFGAFEVDLRTGQLRKHGIRLKLQDQPFRVLKILLSQHGDIVTRQRQIWPLDTFVDFDRGLKNAVKRLREDLSDLADQPRYIETLPKHGYRFVASVQFVTPVHLYHGKGYGTDGPIVPSDADTRRILAIVALAALLLIFALVFLALSRNRSFAAGLAIGCLVYKPQLGIVFGIVVLAAQLMAIAPPSEARAGWPCCSASCRQS
jgi:DNA-binding winged helix-turn-helix (wHTH) protein